MRRRPTAEDAACEETYTQATQVTQMQVKSDDWGPRTSVTVTRGRSRAMHGSGAEPSVADLPAQTRSGLLRWTYGLMSEIVDREEVTVTDLTLDGRGNVLTATLSVLRHPEGVRTLHARPVASDLPDDITRALQRWLS